MPPYGEQPPSTAGRVTLLVILAGIGFGLIWLVDQKAIEVRAEATHDEPTQEEKQATYQELVAAGTDEEILTLLDELITDDPTAINPAWQLALAPTNIERERSIRLMREKFRQSADRALRGKLVSLAGDIGGPDAENFIIWVTQVQNDPDVHANALDSIQRLPATRPLMRALRRYKTDTRMPQYVYHSGVTHSLNFMAEDTFRRFRQELDLRTDDPDWRW